ncbi:MULTISPECIES: hypothetical protein [Bacillus]|uniref:Uncharacterized protein n=2 Tax=Bacillus thuringiensis TaxID=1428 RepID=A0A9X7FW97_BACTU|nr:MULTISPECIES: hypothetical protein [Bacillus]AKR10158.1 hypothetical protein AC241_15940 [Bacillus thuringiensis]KIQ86344.1 hypothetical protein RT27_16055 [Bacillus sp. L_1B0_5]KIQ88665.1 hypothetical protein RW25_13210 [Bacillus sp. L_1B0_8]MBZ8121064.1 hypothetical protein [Bacillus thuringiensis]MCA0999092.1 hypothetical protein [Bacillus thuringiensis]
MIGIDQPVIIIVTGCENNNRFPHAMMHTVIFKYTTMRLDSRVTAGEIVDDEETNVMHHIFQRYGLYNRSSLHYVGAEFIC